jgi:hypothetical protein
MSDGDMRRWYTVEPVLDYAVVGVPHEHLGEVPGPVRCVARPKGVRKLRSGRAQMAVFLITGAIVGIILGLRFKVLVLVPVILLATIVIVLSGSGDKLLTLVGTVVSLQMGYIAGSIVRFLVRSYLPARTRARGRDARLRR